MLSETIVADYIAELVLDVAKDKISEKIDGKKLKSELKAYLQRQHTYNELCSHAEEIDFHGLVDYIHNNLLEEVGTRFLDPNKKKRTQAREDIVAAAVEYSKADTVEAKKRVATCIAVCLDIIRAFYRSHFKPKDYLLADEIVDAVAEEIQSTTQTAVDNLSSQIKRTGDEIVSAIESNGTLFSIDKAIALAECGELTSIERNMTKILEHISLTHPYRPYYGYDYNNGKLVSKPQTEEATKLYPPKIILTGAVKFGEQYYSDFGGDPLDYAYRHQKPLVMEVAKAVKLLGEKLDPSQSEVTDLVGNEVVFTPPEFPPAFPCAIKVRNDTYFKYVLLRTQEIEDDGTYIINNTEQGSALFFEVRINPQNPGFPEFKVRMDHSNNKEWLEYVRFMNAVSKEKDIHIYVLYAEEDIIAGNINNVNYTPAFASIDEECDFLERVCEIEDYFNVTLDICGELKQNEYNTVIRVSDLIRNNEVTSTWNEAVFTGIMTQTFREKVLSMNNGQYAFSYVGVERINLFGAEFELKYMRTYRCAKVKELEKLKRKVEVLDDEDDIKFTVFAGEDKSTVVSLKIPDTLDSSIEH